MDKKVKLAELTVSSPGTADWTKWVYHDATGLLKEKYDAANLDSSGNPISGAKKVAYTYNAAGQPKTRTWARNSVTTYYYFGEGSGEPNTGELRKVDYTDTSMADLEYTYNRLGKTKTVADYTGTRTFTYNLSGTLELQTEQLGSLLGDRRLDWTYDTTGTGTKGRLIQTGLGNYGSAHSIHNQTYTYGGSGRLTGHVINATGYSSQTFAYTYTANSHLLASTVNTALGYTDVRTYLPNANALDIRETKWGAAPKAKFDYTHDSLYRAITVAKTGEVFSIHGNGTQGLETDYAYDDRSQLTADSTTLGGSSTPLSGRDDYHAYDPIGNRTSVNRSGTTVSYTTNLLNQYTTFTGGATHTYDDDGNLTSTGQWDFAYDAENRLVSAETSTGVTPKKRHEFKYDHMGRRVRHVDHTWSGSAWTPVTERRMIYRGWLQIAEYWGAYNAGNLVTTNARYDHWGIDLSGAIGGAGGVGGLLLQQDAGESYLPAYDALGNVHGMIKASDGTLPAIYEYDAFGQTIRASGSYAASNPFRFATNYTDSETGLVNNKTRYYLPSLGRFLNRDTIGERGGLHLYAYVINNPANLYDPFGRDAQGKSAWVPGRGYFYSSWSPGGNSSGSPSGGGGRSGENVVIEVVEPDGSKSYYVHANGVGVSLAPGAAVATAPSGFSLGSSVSVSFSGGTPTIHSGGVIAAASVPSLRGTSITYGEFSNAPLLPGESYNPDGSINRGGEIDYDFGRAITLANQQDQLFRINNIETQRIDSFFGALAAQRDAANAALGEAALTVVRDTALTAGGSYFVGVGASASAANAAASARALYSTARTWQEVRSLASMAASFQTEANYIALATGTAFTVTYNIASASNGTDLSINLGATALETGAGQRFGQTGFAIGLSRAVLQHIDASGVSPSDAARIIADIRASTARTRQLILTGATGTSGSVPPNP